jgi:hypothetical protein
VHILSRIGLQTILMGILWRSHGLGKTPLDGYVFFGVLMVAHKSHDQKAR